jgi:hypothetical protein
LSATAQIRPYQQRRDRRRGCSQTASSVAKRSSPPALLLIVDEPKHAIALEIKALTAPNVGTRPC